jgi:hypothetical protein
MLVLEMSKHSAMPTLKAKVDESGFWHVSCDIETEPETEPDGVLSVCFAQENKKKYPYPLCGRIIKKDMPGSNRK